MFPLKGTNGARGDKLLHSSIPYKVLPPDQVGVAPDQVGVLTSASLSMLPAAVTSCLNHVIISQISCFKEHLKETRMMCNMTQ